MRQTQFKEVIILSAELGAYSKASNEYNTFQLEQTLEEIKIVFNSALGVYKGSSEVRFVTLPKNSDDIEVLKDLAFISYKQESILYQDKHGEAFLIFANGVKESIGKLRQVSSLLKNNLDNYTEMNGNIYTTL